MYKTAIAIHVLAATIWTGGHIVLFFAILLPALKTRDHTRISLFEVQFEKIGNSRAFAACHNRALYGIQTATGHGGLFSFTTAISRTVSLKIALLLLTVALAAHARFKTIPKLNEASLNSLAIHITLVTLTAMLFALTGVLHRFGGII
jgi:putative copper export protein